MKRMGMFASLVAAGACGPSVDVVAGASTVSPLTAAVTAPIELGVHPQDVAPRVQLRGVATDGTHFATAWFATRAGFRATESLHVTLETNDDVDPTGLVLGGSHASRVRGATSPGSIDAQIAFDGTSFVVVWQRDRLLTLARMSASGELIGALHEDAERFGVMAFFRSPLLACTDGVCIVSWLDDYEQRVASVVRSDDTVSTPVVIGGDSVGRAAVATAEGALLHTGFQSVTTFLPWDLASVGERVALVGPPGEPQAVLAAISARTGSGSAFLWFARDRLFIGGGQHGTPVEVDVGFTVTEVFDAAPRGDELLVLVQGLGSSQLMVLRLGPANELRGRREVAAAVAPEVAEGRRASLTCAASVCHVVWRDAAGSVLRSAFVSDTPSESGTRHVVARSEESVEDPQVWFEGGRYAVVYGQSLETRAAFLNVEGTLLDDRHLTGGGGGGAWSAATDDTLVFALYEGGVATTRLDADPTASMTTKCPATQIPLGARGAAANGRSLAVRGGGFDVRDATPESCWRRQGGPGGLPVDAIAGQGFLAVWSSAGEILAQVIDDGGSARGPLLSPFRDPTFIGENFAAVFDGTAYVALLHDGTALQMRRIQPSGVLGVTRTVDATPRDVSGLDATFDGEDIIVAWSERKPGPGTDGDVFAYRVDPMTGAVGDVVTIAATTRDETSPALAPSSPTRVLVAYQVDEPRGVVARRSVEVVVLGAERARGEPCRLDADCENNICQDGRCLEELPTYPPDEDGGEEPTDAAPQPTSGCAAAQVSSPLAPLLLAAAVWRVAKRRRVV